MSEIPPKTDKDEDSWFPFITSPYEFSKGENLVLDFSYLNNTTSKIIIKEGHFVDSRTQERVRFFGTNVCFSDAFPLKDESPLISKRMAQLGINLVRFHHMDHHDILEDKTNSMISPNKLDLLHFFLYCLHKNGIYANINLHVSREYPETEFTKELNEKFRYGKSLDQFYPPFVVDQLQYSLNLLNSYNKYTKCKLGQDPMILNIELNNENSMVDLIRPEKNSAIKNTVFEKELKNQWNHWLVNKYGSFQNIENEWNSDFVLIDRNVDVLKDLKYGNQRDKNTEFKCKFPEFEFIIKSKPQFDWSNQIHFYNFPIKPNSSYTVEFEAKANSISESDSLSLCLSFQESKPPYKGFTKNPQLVNLTSEFKKYSVVLDSKESLETEDKTSTIICKFVLSAKLGKYSVKNVKAFNGQDPIKFWNDEKTIGNILIPSNNKDFSKKTHRDFRLFIQETEAKTQKKLTSFIKNSFPNSNILIVDSQANYGNILSYEREFENSDFLDIHSYWEHPSFDKGFEWNREHFSTRNTPMFTSDKFGTFHSLTLFRPFGKPYTVSEYNHPFPNEHIHEKFPLFGSWAAFHDWDAIYQFSYDQGFRNKDSISGYFSMSKNPIDFALAPILVLAFRKFYVSTSRNYVHLKVPKSFIRDQNEKGNQTGYSLLKPFHAGWNSTFDVEIIDDLSTQKVSEIQCDSNIDINKKGQFITDEIEWKETYRINTPKLRSVTGFIGDSKKSIENDFGILKMRIKLDESLKESATIALASLDDKDLEKSSLILMVVAGKVKNTNQKWNKDRTSTGRKNEGANWGEAPTMVQFIEFEGSLIVEEESSPKIWTINKLGEKNDQIEVEYVDEEKGKKKWKFLSNYSKPSLSFLIERKISDSF